MAAEVASVNICSTAGCGKSATLQCPTCLKLGIQSSYFCNQVGHGFSQCTPERSSVVHPAPLSLPLHVRSVLRDRGRSTEWCTRRPELVRTSLYCSTTHASSSPPSHSDLQLHIQSMATVCIHWSSPTPACGEYDHTHYQLVTAFELIHFFHRPQSVQCLSTYQDQTMLRMVGMAVCMQ